jgi:hypothetical protein
MTLIERFSLCGEVVRNWSWILRETKLKVHALMGRRFRSAAAGLVSLIEMVGGDKDDPPFRRSSS